MSAEQLVSEALLRASRRLARLAAVRQASWLALVALLCGELGLAQHTSPLGILALTACLVLAAAALATATSATPLPLTLAGEVLDARLGRGATFAAAAEAIEGRHPRFASSLVGEAALALRDTNLRTLLPLRPPAALLLGAATALLLPFLVNPGGLAQPRSDVGPRLASLLEPETLAMGGGADPPPDGTPQPPDATLAPVLGTGSSESDPVDQLPLETLERMRALLETLETGADGSSGSGSDASLRDSETDDALDAALRSGDAERIVRELERAAARARQGDRAAALRLAELHGKTAAPGEGSVANADPNAPEPAPDVAPAGNDSPGTGRARPLPRSLSEACERYFSASPG